MQVTNPVTKSVIEIPPIRHGHDTLFECVIGAMIVAEDSFSFTLYLVFVFGGEGTLHCLVWFDSQVGEWREIMWPPRSLMSYVEIEQDMLYMLFWDWDEDIDQVFALDTVCNTWRCMDVDLPMFSKLSQLSTILIQSVCRVC